MHVAALLLVYLALFSAVTEGFCLRMASLESKIYDTSLSSVTSKVPDTGSSLPAGLELPWFATVAKETGVDLLAVREWQDEVWRNSEEGGFQGKDFCHSASASVRILNYAMIPPSYSAGSDINHSKEDVDERYQFPQLIGPAHFTPRAESHQGLCHGGSFCALMDDAIGWLGFCVSGSVIPWSGYTVQVNTALKKPVPVNSILRLESWVKRREGSRKFWIEARLVDPNLDNCVHCEAQGLFLLSPEHAKF